MYTAAERRNFMDHDIQLFHNDDFGDIRTVIIDGEPWFVAKDVASLLGYKETAKAVRFHIDDEDKGVSILDTPGGKQRITVINESGVYCLILSSNLPKARLFKHWVTSEVLPSLRKTGRYGTDDAAYLINKFFPVATEQQRMFLQTALLQIETLTATIAENQPKVDFAEQVANTDALIDMETMAKLATDNGIRIGRNRLFQWLRDIGVLIRNSNPKRNLPYQEYLDRGYFKVREKCFQFHGAYRLYYQTMVTGKGQLYIIGRLRNEYHPEMYPPEL